MIRIAETTEKEETKISIWKYLIEMREASLEKNIGLAARSSDETKILKELEAPTVEAPKPDVPVPSNVAESAT